MAPVPTPHPRWTPLGTLATPVRGLVDGRGRVAADLGWALDWWVGADDRWHLPGREASVRQHLVGDAPVVETAMRIPGGDAVHRAYAVRDRGADGQGRDLLVVEIENRSAVPFALALVVTPCDRPGRAGSVSALVLDGSVLWVDGRPGVAAPKAPPRAGATADHRELEALVVGGHAPAALAPLSSPGGTAGAALIYPLPHTAVLRAVVPLAAEPPRRRRGGAGRPGAFSVPDALATAEQVAKGWEAQTRRPMTITIPDERWTSVTEASRGFLLLGAGDDGGAGAGAGAGLSWVDSVTLVGALDRWDFGAEATRALAGAGDERRDPRPVDGATLVALADHWSFIRDPVELAGHDLAIAAAVRRSDRPGRRPRRPAGAPADPGQDVAWRARGLEAAAVLLEALDQPDAATVVRERARPLVAQPAPRPADPARLALAHPSLGGLSPALTLGQATRDLADPATGAVALDRVAWALSVLGPTPVWPEAIDPDRPDLARGRGHDPVASAAWLTFVRTLLVRETGTEAEPELALCSWLPPTWRGQSFEIHHAPTPVGSLSYAVRWHGLRPALLWELDPHPGRPGSSVTLRAPGLDGAWSTREPRGEALLAAAVDDQPVGPGQVGLEPPGSPGEGASFS